MHKPLRRVSEYDGLIALARSYTAIATRNIDRNCVLDAINQCTERERLAIMLRFGLVDGIAHPYYSIAEKMGICRERVIQLIKNGTHKMSKITHGRGYV